MNKAFMKEAEDETSPKCPACLAIGQEVGSVTLARHLEAGAAVGLAAGSACFCPNPTCDVAYFDANRQTVAVARLVGLAWPKSAAMSAVICGCTGVTVGQVVEDARRKDPARVRGILEQAKREPGRCVEGMANGRSCVGEVQRVYLRNLAK